MSKAEQEHEALAKMSERRMVAGTCRHCGHKIPCWSEFGDCAIGKRHTAATFRAMRAQMPRWPNE